MKKLNRGFTLITALFLLVVVALLSVYMINLRSVQQSTIVFGLQGARAMQAAQTGLEWGVYDAINNNCASAPSTFNVVGVPALESFSIQVTCVFSDHTEGTAPADTITTYVLTSTAQTGTYGTLDYVYRSVRATVSAQPP
jgi:MSHA biogenesis protein MshP